VKDILLTGDGDLKVGENGDIALTDSVRQAIKIRLLWFLREWRFAPDYGVPYYEEILVKNPNLERIRRIIKNEILSVEEAGSVKSVTIAYDKSSRVAGISFIAVVNGEELRDEVKIDV
jgi:hypothetical protein